MTSLYLELSDLEVEGLELLSDEEGLEALTIARLGHMMAEIGASSGNTGCCSTYACGGCCSCCAG